MIEFELRFKVEKFPSEERLKFIKEKDVVDIYYDTKDYKLIREGNFLRNRNNKTIDFKLELGDLSHLFCNELNFDYANFADNLSLQKIFSGLRLDYNKDFDSFETFTQKNNLIELCKIDKHRRIFKLEDLEISFDEEKSFGKFIEAEIDLDENEKIDKEAIKKYILDKLLKFKIIEKPYEKVEIGYVEIYLKKFNPKVYDLGLFKTKK